MRRIPIPACTAALILLVSGMLPAQTHDVADYFMLTPGYWRIEEQRDPGNPTPVKKTASVVTTLGQYTLQNGFKWDGKAWQVGYVQVFELTATHLVHHGEFNPGNNKFMLFSPPVRIPRLMKLNDPFTHKGKVLYPTSVAQGALTVILTADNLTQKTKAGTFTGCIRFMVSILSDQYAEIRSEVRARKLGFVKGVRNEVDETKPEASMVDTMIHERIEPKQP